MALPLSIHVTGASNAPTNQDYAEDTGSPSYTAPNGCILYNDGSQWVFSPAGPHGSDTHLYTAAGGPTVSPVGLTFLPQIAPSPAPIVTPNAPPVPPNLTAVAILLGNIPTILLSGS